ncbi:MAG: hypothetical protein CL816_01985 [Coxiellaceae bacterium]|nr:hypothetical protein [Coxiellaceae bacterium]|tara:strand:+ start:6218 stop:6601 length:384 start_codon:yes stop_codon:yes gene_type:complete
MSDQSGFALLLVLCWIAIISVLIMGLTAHTKMQSLLLRAHRDHQQAFYQAELGLKCASISITDHHLSNCNSLQQVIISVGIVKNDQGRAGYQLRSEARVGDSRVVLEAFGRLNTADKWIQNWWRVVQ